VPNVDVSVYTGAVSTRGVYEVGCNSVVYIKDILVGRFVYNRQQLQLWPIPTHVPIVDVGVYIRSIHEVGCDSVIYMKDRLVGCCVYKR